jgi:hypothetical protein
MLLEGKIKTMLAGGPSKAGSNAFDRVKGLIAAQASTSPLARCDAVAWEGILQSLGGASGDSEADILVVLISKYSFFRSRSSARRSRPPTRYSAALPPSPPNRRSALQEQTCAQWAPTTGPSLATRWPSPLSTARSSPTAARAPVRSEPV